VCGQCGGGHFADGLKYLWESHGGKPANIKVLGLSYYSTYSADPQFVGRWSDFQHIDLTLFMKNLREIGGIDD
jgi:hypothetical protein